MVEKDSGSCFVDEPTLDQVETKVLRSRISTLQSALKVAEDALVLGTKSINDSIFVGADNRVALYEVRTILRDALSQIQQMKGE